MAHNDTELVLRSLRLQKKVPKLGSLNLTTS